MRMFLIYIILLFNVVFLKNLTLHDYDNPSASHILDAEIIDNTLILALPGSTNGAKESMDALFPSVLHLFKVIHGFRHD